MKPLLNIDLVLPRIGQRDYFKYLFSLKYTVVINSKDPEIVIYDDYSRKHIPKYTGKPVMIAFTGESADLNYELCTCSLSFDEDHPKSIYMPLWVIFIDWFNTLDPNCCPLSEIILRPPLNAINRDLFCGFVAENPVKNRRDFVTALSQYKTVTCPGRVLNNHPPIGGRMGPAKERFLRRCKFTVAFENRTKPGYLTEKILHAFQSRTIPIYWGSPTVAKYFNSRAFINCHDYADWDQIIAEVMRLDNDDAAYLAMLNEPVFPEDLPPRQFWPAEILTAIEKFTNLS